MNTATTKSSPYPVMIHSAASHNITITPASPMNAQHIDMPKNTVTTVSAVPMVTGKQSPLASLVDHQPPSYSFNFGASNPIVSHQAMVRSAPTPPVPAVIRSIPAPQPIVHSRPSVPISTNTTFSSAAPFQPSRPHTSRNTSVAESKRSSRQSVGSTPQKSSSDIKMSTKPRFGESIKTRGGEDLDILPTSWVTVPVKGGVNDPDFRPRGFSVSSSSSSGSSSNWDVKARYLMAVRSGPTEIPDHIVAKHPLFPRKDFPSPFTMYYFDESAPNDILLRNDVGRDIPSVKKMFGACGGHHRREQSAPSRSTSSSSLLSSTSSESSVALARSVSSHPPVPSASKTLSSSLVTSQPSISSVYKAPPPTGCCSRPKRPTSVPTVSASSRMSSNSSIGSSAHLGHSMGVHSREGMSVATSLRSPYAYPAYMAPSLSAHEYHNKGCCLHGRQHTGNSIKTHSTSSSSFTNTTHSEPVVRAMMMTAPVYVADVPHQHFPPPPYYPQAGQVMTSSESSSSHLMPITTGNRPRDISSHPTTSVTSKTFLESLPAREVSVVEHRHKNCCDPSAKPGQLSSYTSSQSSSLSEVTLTRSGSRSGTQSVTRSGTSGPSQSSTVVSSLSHRHQQGKKCGECCGIRKHTATSVGSFAPSSVSSSSGTVSSRSPTVVSKPTTMGTSPLASSASFVTATTYHNPYIHGGRDVSIISEVPSYARLNPPKKSKGHRDLGYKTRKFYFDADDLRLPHRGSAYRALPSFSTSYKNFPTVCFDVIVPENYVDFFEERKAPGFLY